MNPVTSNSTLVAIVTGSSRGIGRGIAQRLARDGFRVVVNYHRSAESAADLVTEMERSGGQAMAVQADVSQAEDRRRLLERTLDAWGRLDLLVNNAGITSPGRNDLLDVTEESWDAVMGTNLKGPFFLAQQAARAMLRLLDSGTIERGTLINISSISAFTVSLNRADYCLAKAAMAMMTQLFAARLADRNIMVYEICPGIIASDMTAPVRAKYDALIAEGLAPMRRWGQPEDVAAAVATLAAGQLTYCTGQTLLIDGGLHIRRL